MPENVAMCKRRLLVEALEMTEEGLEALRTWDTYLRVWLTYPDKIDDKLFMIALQDLAEVIGYDFIDGFKVDDLRKALTGVDARYSELEV